MRRTEDSVSFSPTDVSDFLSCQHLTLLERRVVDGELERPAQNEIERRLLEKRGLEHEARVLEHFRSRGLPIVEIPLAVGERALREAAGATLAAMADGAELIYQGVLMTQGWLGRPERTEGGMGTARRWCPIMPSAESAWNTSSPVSRK